MAETTIKKENIVAISYVPRLKNFIVHTIGGFEFKTSEDLRTSMEKTPTRLSNML